MSKKSNAQLQAELEQALARIAELEAKKKPASWRANVSVQSPLRVIGLKNDDPNLPLLKAIDQLPVGHKLPFSPEQKTAVYAALTQSSLAGEWDAATATYLYTRKTSNSGKTIADGVQFRLYASSKRVPRTEYAIERIA